MGNENPYSRQTPATMFPAPLPEQASSDSEEEDNEERAERLFRQFRRYMQRQIIQESEENNALLQLMFSALKGNAKAQNDLAKYTDAEKTAVVEWCRKAAEQGHVNAQYILGRCYDDGVGVEKNENAAVGWYRKAAEQGHVEAKQQLSNIEEEMKKDESKRFTR